MYTCRPTHDMSIRPIQVEVTNAFRSDWSGSWDVESACYREIIGLQYTNNSTKQLGLNISPSPTFLAISTSNTIHQRTTIATGVDLSKILEEQTQILGKCSKTKLINVLANLAFLNIGGARPGRLRYKIPYDCLSAWLYGSRQSTDFVFC